MGTDDIARYRGLTSFFLFKKGFWITLLKIFLLVFVASMVAMQFPELRYDSGSKEPVQIQRPGDLSPDRLPPKVFASIEGRPDFSKAFIQQKYGLTYTYFAVQPYGLKLVVRTFDTVDEDWKQMDRLVGKLAPFDDQPFSYRISEIYETEFQETIPENAYFLGLYDVPKIDGFQLGAVIFASVMWIVMFLMFFVFKLKIPGPRSNSPQGSYPEQTGKSKT